MKRSDMNRRDFHKLTMAALGGVVAGAGLAAEEKEAAKTKDPDKPLLLQEPHVCRGLNTCKSKGKGAENACAGQGSCATAEAHTCAGDNACRGLGGCGENPGENACKAQGKCNVPLTAQPWGKARKHFEEAMTKAGKKFGEAPAKK